MKRLRRVHPLYWLALVLFIAALVASALTADTSGGVSRSASVYDAGPGGTAALRKYLEAMGAFTMTVQGDTFAADPSQIGVLFILGPSEQFTQFDALAVRRFVTAGGTAVLASDTGLPESALLDTFDVQVAGPIGPGRYPIRGAPFADPPTPATATDRGIAVSPAAGRARASSPSPASRAWAGDHDTAGAPAADSSASSGGRRRESLGSIRRRRSATSSPRSRRQTANARRGCAR